MTGIVWNARPPSRGLSDRHPWNTHEAGRLQFTTDVARGVGHGLAYYKLYAFLKLDRLRNDWSRDRILQALEAEGVPGLSGSCPEIYREKAFTGRNHPRLPVASELGATSVMFLVHPTLEDKGIDDMSAAIRKVLAAASR